MAEPSGGGKSNKPNKGGSTSSALAALAEARLGKRRTDQFEVLCLTDASKILPWC
jgi:Mrp family chromosome partitioning ATPase